MPARSTGQILYQMRKSRVKADLNKEKVGVSCTALYHGESGYSAYTHELDHQKDLANKKKTNLLWRPNYFTTSS